MKNKQGRCRFNERAAGFTLIEMMVVVVVIGLLAGAILVGLGPARNKGRDTRIISDVNQVRALAETYYDPTDSNGAPYADVVVGDTKIAALANDVTAQSGVLVIVPASPTTAYAAFSKLASDAAKFYCVDSTGFAGTVPDPTAKGGVCQ